MKKLLSVLVLFCTITLNAQDPYLQNDSDKFEVTADSITEKFNAQLALSSQQELLFKQKIEEFLIRAEKQTAGLKGKDKLDRLYRLEKFEIAEMGDILTRPQYQLYKKLKPQIQPLATVKKE